MTGETPRWLSGTLLGRGSEPSGVPPSIRYYPAQYLHRAAAVTAGPERLISATGNIAHSS